MDEARGIHSKLWEDVPRQDNRHGRTLVIVFCRRGCRCWASSKLPKANLDMISVSPSPQPPAPHPTPGRRGIHCLTLLIGTSHPILQSLARVIAGNTGATTGNLPRALRPCACRASQVPPAQWLRWTSCPCLHQPALAVIKRTVSIVLPVKIVTNAIIRGIPLYDSDSDAPLQPKVCPEQCMT